MRQSAPNSRPARRAELLAIVWLGAVLTALLPATPAFADDDVEGGDRSAQAESSLASFYPPLSEISTDLRLEGQPVPADESEGLFVPADGQRPDWAEFEFWWEPTEFYHQPLYFDDVSLERYGHSWSPVLQPGLSAAHFFSQTTLLPWKVLVDHPCGRVTHLGYERPGNFVWPVRTKPRLAIDPLWLHPLALFR